MKKGGKNIDLHDVSLVVVTHGDRLHLISGCLNAAIEDRASKIYVVANGVSDKVLEFLLSAQRTFPGRVEVVKLGKNRGSAGGFYEGLKNAYKGPNNPILLLDDDNWITKGTIEQFLNRDLKHRDRENPRIFLAFRPVNVSHSKIVAGVEGPELRVPGAAGGFDFFTWLKIKVNKSVLKPNESATKCPTYLLPSGTYGGLYLPLEVIAWGALPNKHLVLYGDDIELTERFVEKGALIELCPEIILADVEMSRTVEDATNEDINRLKYHYRNMIFLDLQYAKKHRHRLRFSINFCFFLFYLAKQSVTNKHLNISMGLAWAAIEGVRGRLGSKWDL